MQKVFKRNILHFLVSSAALFNLTQQGVPAKHSNLTVRLAVRKLSGKHFRYEFAWRSKRLWNNFLEMKILDAKQGS